MSTPSFPQDGSDPPRLECRMERRYSMDDQGNEVLAPRGLRTYWCDDREVSAREFTELAHRLGYVPQYVTFT